MQVIELSNNKLHIDKWQRVLEYIESSNDRLKDNYLNLDPSSFISFQAVVKDDNIICFSGLQSSVEKWGPYILRCSSRMWVHPEYRFTSLTKFTRGNKFLNSYYIIPSQLKLASDLGFKCVFMSREKNPRGFVEWANLVNNNAGASFEVLPDVYNVCGFQDPVPMSCKQRVALNYTNEALDIWNQYMSEYVITDSILDSIEC